ncbi:MAG: hypothetical protein AMJ69_09820 [Gammaproteobacteria bacterium SG8_47]|jgi:FixJ family two-component response regulator|nr:MAG: hypothetical protein AMJ69_09820 [Gammaproteobacteria bacterium SG8_47]
MDAADDVPTVYVLDDDAAVRTALARLLRSANMRAVVFASVDELLAQETPNPHSCVVADIRMQGTRALALPRLLQARGVHVPVIFVSAQDTEQTRADAREAGAAGFFRKPVDDQALVDAIAWAVGHSPPQAQAKQAP